MQERSLPLEEELLLNPTEPLAGTNCKMTGKSRVLRGSQPEGGARSRFREPASPSIHPSPGAGAVCTIAEGSRSGQHPAFATANTLATLAFLCALACDTAGASLDDNCFSAPIPARSHVSFGFLGPSLGPARPPASTRAGDFSAAYTPTQDVKSQMAEHANGAADEGVANGAAGASPALKFTQLAKCSTSLARVGRLWLPHNELETPIFMPVGTAAAVKGITADELEALDVPLILGNTYHLALRPGTDLLAEMGGLHKFMGWKRAMLTDSGGFQVLLHRNVQRFRGGLAFEAHRLYVSLNSRLSNKEELLFFSTS